MSNFSNQQPQKFKEPPISTTPEERRKFFIVIILATILVILIVVATFLYNLQKPNQHTAAGPRELFNLIGERISEGLTASQNTSNNEQTEDLNTQ